MNVNTVQGYSSPVPGLPVTATQPDRNLEVGALNAIEEEQGGKQSPLASESISTRSSNRLQMAFERGLSNATSSQKSLHGRGFLPKVFP